MPAAERSPAALARLPRLGWVESPSPVSALPNLARHLVAEWVGVKRDDLLPSLHGGSKLRKLDLLLAERPFVDAPAWTSVGAIGSGHLAAVAAAARTTNKVLDAHVFWEPPSAGVLENLAFTASWSRNLEYHRSRTALGLAHPTVLWATELGGLPLIPAGATTAAGVAGVARAGFELAEQIANGELPLPDEIYVALGSGGTAAGLALGLGLAGVETRVRAVAAVERVGATRWRVRSLIAAGARWFREHGLADADPARAVPFTIDHRQLGPGYGVPTAQSLAACELAASDRGGMDRAPLALEPIYTGKAFAALLYDLARARGKKVLFWHTARRGPLETSKDWRERLPPELRQRLDRATSPRRVGRRVVLGSGLAAAAGLAVMRFGGYPSPAGWAGSVLSTREALTLAAGAEAILPLRPGPAPLEIAANVDRYLVSMPPNVQLQIHGLLALVEHGTTPLGLRLHRFTALDADAREAFLASLRARGGLLAQAYRGLRDLLLLGYYQSPATWPDLAYDGPWGDAAGPALADTPYDEFRSKSGQLPRGVRSEVGR